MTLFVLNYSGRRVYAVTGPSFPFRKADGYTLWLGQLKVLNTWSPSQVRYTPRIQLNCLAIELVSSVFRALVIRTT